jgi:CRISPR/Cas system CSM-associated protein Csm3 (group 7 of RAMP superfamily)
MFEFDLDSSEGLQIWQSRPYGMLDPLPSSAREVRLGNEGLEIRRDDDTLTGPLRVELEATGPLLVGGSSVVTDESKEADLTFLEIPFADYETESLRGVAWIPGSALKGVIRHRAEYILRSLGLSDDERRAAMIDSLFGCVRPAEQADGSVKTVARKSKVTIRGCLIKEPAYVTVQHVAIDRFTGGALEGALYAEAPIWCEGMKVPISLEFAEVTPGEACLLAHVLMDLGEGRLPIGGGGGRGNGRLRFLNCDQSFPAKGETRFSLVWRGRNYTQDSPRDELAELLSSLKSGFQQALA